MRWPAELCVMDCATRRTAPSRDLLAVASGDIPFLRVPHANDIRVGPFSSLPPFGPMAKFLPCGSTVSEN